MAKVSVERILNEALCLINKLDSNNDEALEERVINALLELENLRNQLVKSGITTVEECYED